MLQILAARTVRPLKVVRMSLVAQLKKDREPPALLHRLLTKMNPIPRGHTRFQDFPSRLALTGVVTMGCMQRPRQRTPSQRPQHSSVSLDAKRRKRAPFFHYLLAVPLSTYRPAEILRLESLRLVDHPNHPVGLLRRAALPTQLFEAPDPLTSVARVCHRLCCHKRKSPKDQHLGIR